MFDLPPAIRRRALLAKTISTSRRGADSAPRAVADGRTRAFVNDQPVSVQALKAIGATLVEIHGQHDDRALADAATHRRLLDAFAGLEKEVARWTSLWETRRTAHEALEEHRASMERAAREADYLRHAVDELRRWSRRTARRTRSRGRRTIMMQAEKIAGDLREAQEAIGGTSSPVAVLAAAVRRLERRPPVRRAGRTGGEGDRCRDQRAGGGRSASRRRRCRGRFRSRPSWSASRSGCSRCARRRANTPRRSTASRRCAAKFVADVALIDAGADRLKKLEAAAAEADDALRRRGDEAVGGARQVRRRSSTRPSTPNWRRSSSNARNS